METRMARFIAGLRASGVRVSMAESQDAWRAVELLGVGERDLFRQALRATLIKEAVDIPTFEELFPLYFGLGAPPLLNPQAELSPDEQNLLQQALEQFSQELAELLNWLFSGQGPTEEELRELAEQTGIERGSSPYQARWYARRMQRLLNWDRLPQVLDMIFEHLAEQGMDPQQIEQLKQQVGENMTALQQQLEAHAGQRIQENMAEEWQSRRDNVHDLMERSFGSLNENEMDVLREQVRRLAARLRSRAALRQKRGKRGKLDAKSTIRANQRYGGVPMELRMRRRRLKPKLVTILDVSTSMRPVAEFFLRLLYELQDTVQKAYSFAFIDHIENVTADMQSMGLEMAVQTVLNKLPPGYYSTDLGSSLRGFHKDHLGLVDGRTTLIVLGDGRNNYNDPELAIFDEIVRRARRVIWMNPEYPAQWGTGDSDMLEYAPLCTEVHQVRNLQQLTDAIDKMLSG